MKNPIIPPLDKPKATFLNNLDNKAPVYKTVLDITDAELASVHKDAVMFNYIINVFAEAYKTKGLDVTEFKNIMRDGPLGKPTPAMPEAPTLPVAPAAVDAGIFPRTSKFIKRLKSHGNYTVNIGKDLGIEGEEHVIDPLTMKPLLKGALDAGRPLIIWNKGDASSIDLYVDRQMNDSYVYLANDSEPDYIDTYHLTAGVNSAVWRYKGIYRLGDEQVGIFSEPITITVTKTV